MEKFPRRTHDQKRSTKLSEVEVKVIQKDFPKNPNYKLFAERYDVSRDCIRYWVDEEWRRKKLDANRVRKRSRSNDPVTRKYDFDLANKANKKLKENFPEIVKWYNKMKSTPKWVAYHKEYESRPEVQKRIKQNREKPERVIKRKEYDRIKRLRLKAFRRFRLMF